MGLYSAKIQKRVSRVGRFKIKQELINNPDQLLYVDDEKAKNEDGTPYLNERKRPGFFKFLAEIIKDNKRYNKYLKTEFVEAKKKSMARESIELTPEQILRAEQLQTNTFKMFNKLDEKSQNLSESTEAMGEILSQGLSGIIAMAGLLMALINNAKEQAKGKDISKKTILYTYAPIVLSLLIANGINIIVTKEQKKASKVANMLAINEMDDYKNFVDYNAKLKQDASESN